MSQLLLESPLNTEQCSYVHTITHSADALLNLISDILDFSKIEAGKLTIEAIPFDLHGLVREVEEVMRIKAQQNHLEFRTMIHPNVPPLIKGDRGRICQILYNLVGNALKFTQQGCVTIEVKAHEVTQQSCVIDIIVQDTGIGISLEQQGLIFQKFQQADNSTTRRFGGTGLGLAISQQLAQLMQGSVGVESEYGQGSTFWIRLPVSIAPEVVWSEAREVAAHKALNLEGKLVLVAEDNKVNQAVAKALLTKYACRVVVANHGAEAVAKCGAERFDLILMDCQMPELDGFEATAQIRQQEQQEVRRRTPIVALTANAIKGDRERCLEHGMDDYMSKPIQKAQLEAVLGRWLGGGDGAAPDSASSSSSSPPSSSTEQEGA